MQGILEKSLVTESRFATAEHESVQKIGVFGKLFGCWHKRLSRPFTSERTSYRSCLECGARRNFDTENFKTSGPFYFPRW